MSRILVIEDDLNARTGLEKLLGLEGFDVVGVTTGREGIAVAEEQEVDVVLCDYRLPDVNGLEVCRVIKTCREKARLMLVTAFCSFEIQKKATEVGVEKVFSKPLDLDDLLHTLNDSRNAMEAAPEPEPTTNSCDAL